LKYYHNADSGDVNNCMLCSVNDGNLISTLSKKQKIKPFVIVESLRILQFPNEFYFGGII
jgi:hypothetical protein